MTQLESDKFICNWDGQYADGQEYKVGEYSLCQIHQQEHGLEVSQMNHRSFLRDMIIQWKIWGFI